MTQREEKRWRELRDEVLRCGDPADVVDLLLALDRMVVEVSLRVYRVSRRERSAMRKHHRRLHHAVREHLPRLLGTSSGPA